MTDKGLTMFGAALAFGGLLALIFIGSIRISEAAYHAWGFPLFLLAGAVFGLGVGLTLGGFAVRPWQS